MNKIQLLLLLRRNVRLSEKRSPMYEQNKVSKFVIGLLGLYVAFILLSLSITLSLAAINSKSHTSYEVFFGMTPFILVLDFFSRFVMQQTPAQLVKPYLLMPIPKHTCIEMFIFSSMITPNNLIWLILSVPYAIMTILFNDGFFTALGLIVAFQIIIVINSQWYMLVRTLINNKIWWWALPAAVYGTLAVFFHFDKLDFLTDAFAAAGTGLAKWNPLHYLCLIAVLWVFFEINKRIQYKFTYSETTGTENSKLKNVSELNALSRYGDTGEYIKIEVKSLMRNKNMRNSFVFGTIAIIALSLVISFTDIYSDGFTKNFWVVYNFILYGATMLIKIMSAEGNYIDGLMVHKENIMQLLKAKYYFYSALLILPLVLMLPTVFTGKYTLLALVSMMAFAAGPVYCLLMQTAVYNRQTIPLNTKFISRGSIETNYFMIASELAAMFAPVFLISILKTFFSDNTTFITLLIIGIAFIATHKIWIRNIYKRIMQRRYKNMEGFRATR